MYLISEAPRRKALSDLETPPRVDKLAQLKKLGVLARGIGCWA